MIPLRVPRCTEIIKTSNHPKISSIASKADTMVFRYHFFDIHVYQSVNLPLVVVGIHMIKNIKMLKYDSFYMYNSVILQIKENETCEVNINQMLTYLVRR